MKKIVYRVKCSEKAEYLEVSVKLIGFNSEEFWMPSWTPGSYLNRCYAQNVFNINVFDEKKTVLKTTKSRKLSSDRWKIALKENEGFSYEVYAATETVRGVYRDREYGYFTPAALLLFPLIAADEYHLDLSLLPNPVVALPTKEVGVFVASSVDELIDSPVIFGEMKSFDVMDSPKHRLHVFGSIMPHSDMERLVADTQKIVKEHCSFFASPSFDVPYEFFLQLKHGGFGGLEHDRSTLLQADPCSLIIKEGNESKYQDLLALISHEYFHRWWVKAIRPLVYKKYNYLSEDVTAQLWIFEGITSYYENVALLRAGLLSLEEWQKRIEKDLVALQRSGEKQQSLAESSEEAWTKLYRRGPNAVNDVVSYYTKGAVVALLLDFNLRFHWGVSRGLDEILQSIWQKGQRSFAEGEFENIVLEAVIDAKKDEANAFFNEMLRAREKLDIKTHMAHIGFEVVSLSQPEKLSYWGLTLNPGSTEIANILTGSPLIKAGLRPKDKILAINQVQTHAENIPKLLFLHENKVVTIHYFRNGLLEHCRVDLKADKTCSDGLEVKIKSDWYNKISEIFAV